MPGKKRLPSREPTAINPTSGTGINATDAATSVCLKANPENVAPSALATCINLSVHMAMSRIESDLDATVHGKLSNVRTAMRDL